jgi:hypothetical protein
VKEIQARLNEIQIRFLPLNLDLSMSCPRLRKRRHASRPLAFGKGPCFEAFAFGERRLSMRSAALPAKNTRPSSISAGTFRIAAARTDKEQRARPFVKELSIFQTTDD